jgi:hypothetical protein
MDKNVKLGLIGRKRKIKNNKDNNDNKKEIEDEKSKEEESFEEKPKILCQICKKEEYKYNCPRCSLKTCSVKCVKAHKSKYGCDGEKDKFKLVTNQDDYNEKVFHRDVSFLNNAIKDINISNKKIYYLTEDIDSAKAKTFKTFKRILKKFRDINYFKSPLIMECNKFNKSYSDSAQKKIFWTIKLNFLDDKLTYIYDKVFDGDEANINKLIEYLNNNKQSVDKNNVGLLDIIKNKEWFNNYDFYLKMDIFDLSLEEKKNYFYYKKYYYFLCKLDTPINELLKGKNVYEYPEFYLIKKS